MGFLLFRFGPFIGNIVGKVLLIEGCIHGPCLFPKRTSLQMIGSQVANRSLGPFDSASLGASVQTHHIHGIEAIGHASYLPGLNGIFMRELHGGKRFLTDFEKGLR